MNEWMGNWRSERDWSGRKNLRIHVCVTGFLCSTMGEKKTVLGEIPIQKLNKKNKKNILIHTTGKVKVWIQQLRLQVFKWWVASDSLCFCHLLCSLLPSFSGRHPPSGGAMTTVSICRQSGSLSQSFQHVSQGWPMFTSLDWTPLRFHTCLWSPTVAMGKQYLDWPELSHVSTFGTRTPCLLIPNSERNKIPTCFIGRIDAYQVKENHMSP